MIIPQGGIQNIALFLPPLPGEPEDTKVGNTYLGTPVYSNLIFNNRDVKLDTVIIEVNQEKNIVRTPIQGRDGTVKEYISLGDYEIFIQGLIVSPYANVSPRDEVQALTDILKLSESLEVSSDFLQIFPIHNIVVQGYTFGQMMGFRNQIPFTIRALSDEPIEVREI